jgi:beta-lactamase class A
MRNRIIIVILFALVLVLGIVIGWFAVAHEKTEQQTASIQVRADSPEYTLINPLLFSQSPKSTAPAFVTLQKLLTAYVASTTENNAASSVSVYFRDLNSGQWTGVNENDLYTPASMLKVIAMMATLQLAQANPSLLDEQLPYIATSSDSYTQYYEPNDGTKSGDYSVQDLVGIMIRYSDNSALDALLSDSNINNEFTQIYNLFRLPAVSATSTSDFMSPKSYSSVFISLYNSSLFPWALSEQVLNLLANTTFTQGLVAGVPSGTIVAHKFGESSDTDSSGNIIDRQLHDCGIVYYPGDPYLLCVMTRGQDYPTLAGVISGVSNLVYNYVNGKPF